jgi:oligopeptide transport system permease protein
VTAFVIRRLLWTIPLILVVMLVTFALMRGIGGSPFRLEFGGVPYALQLRFERYYGLDDPWFVEFWNYVRHVSTFDFGPSLTNRYVTVDQVIKERFPVSLALSGLAAAWAVPLGIGLGLVAALARNTRVDRVATVIATIILVLGLLYGAVSGLAGRKVDDLMMRIVDGLFAIPRLPWVLIVLVLIGANGSIFTVILALSLFSWMTTARLVRSQILALKQNDFVRAARALGARRHHIFLRHLVPNTFGVLLVAVLLELPGIILGEAFVSVLGLGINAPAATWGNIAQDGLSRNNPYFLILPSAAIALLAVAVNFIADGLQDAFDPRREGASQAAGWNPLTGFVRTSGRVGPRSEAV